MTTITTPYTGVNLDTYLKNGGRELVRAYSIAHATDPIDPGDCFAVTRVFTITMPMEPEQGSAVERPFFFQEAIYPGWMAAWWPAGYLTKRKVNGFILPTAGAWIDQLNNMPFAFPTAVNSTLQAKTRAFWTAYGAAPHNFTFSYGPS